MNAIRRANRESAVSRISTFALLLLLILCELATAQNTITSWTGYEEFGQPGCNPVDLVESSWYSNGLCEPSSNGKTASVTTVTSNATTITSTVKSYGDIACKSLKSTVVQHTKYKESTCTSPLSSSQQALDFYSQALYFKTSSPSSLAQVASAVLTYYLPSANGCSDPNSVTAWEATYPGQCFKAVSGGLAADKCRFAQLYKKGNSCRIQCDGSNNPQIALYSSADCSGTSTLSSPIASAPKSGACAFNATWGDVSNSWSSLTFCTSSVPVPVPLSSSSGAGPHSWDNVDTGVTTVGILLLGGIGAVLFFRLRKKNYLEKEMGQKIVSGGRVDTIPNPVHARPV